MLLWLRRENRNQFGGGHHLFDSLLPASTGVIGEAAGKRRTWNEVLCGGGGGRSVVSKVEGGCVIIEVCQVFRRLLEVVCCAVLCCTILYFTILYCTVLCCDVLYCDVM